MPRKRVAGGPRSRVNKRGEKVWYVRVKDFPFRTFGSGQRGYQDALRYYTECKTQKYSSGGDPDKRTFRELAEASESKLLKKLRNQKDRDTRITRIRMLVDRFGHRPVSSIVMPDIEDIQEWLRSKPVRKGKIGYTGKTVNEFCNLFRRIMDRAVVEGLLAKNPLQGFEREEEKSSSEIRRPLTEDQWDAFYSTLKEGWVKDALLGYLHTGCRKMELASLNWDQVHLDAPIGDYFEIVNRMDGDEGDDFEAKSKAGVRFVPISTALRTVLERNLEAKTPYPFPGPGGRRISPNTIYNNFKAAIRRFNKRKDTTKKIRKDTRLHDLRHTFGCWSARKVPLPTLKTIMGHKSITQTAEYCEQDSKTAIQDFHRLGPFTDTAPTHQTSASID